jgi:hypothetical protein
MGDRLVFAILKYFRDCSHKGLKMNKLVISDGSFNVHLVSVLYATISLDIFQEIQLQNLECLDADLCLELLLVMGDKNCCSKRLKYLEIDSVYLTSEFIMVLSDLSKMAPNLEMLSFLNTSCCLLRPGLEFSLGSCAKLKNFAWICIWRMRNSAA